MAAAGCGEPAPRLDPDAPLLAWQDLPDIGLPRYEAGSVVVDGKLYVFGGFHGRELDATPRVDIFDPATATWSRGADMPVAVTHRIPVRVGTDVWLAGGFVGRSPGPSTDEVWRYDTVADDWTAGPPLPEPRAGGVAGLLGRRLHYVGGYLEDRNTEAGDHWALDLDDAGGWNRRAPIPLPTGHTAGVVLDGRLYVVGGALGHDPIQIETDRVYSYDPESDAWSRHADLPFSRSHTEGSTLVAEGRILVVGGRSVAYRDGFIPDVTMYDPALDVWIARAPYPDPVLAPAAAWIDGRLIVSTGRLRAPDDTIGIDIPATRAATLSGRWELGDSLPRAPGRSTGAIVGDELFLFGDATESTLVLDLATGRWHDVRDEPRRPLPYAQGSAAASWGGRVYLFGGERQAMTRVQVLAPATREWRLGRPLPVGTRRAAAVAIGDRIYVAGGIDDSGASAVLQAYEPAREAWVRLADLPRPVGLHAAGTDGERLYLFGGREPAAAGGSNDPLRLVQVYDPATDSWGTGSEPGPELPDARSDVMYAPYVGGRFHLLGGRTPDGGAPRVLSYDPRADSWETGAPMPGAREGVMPLAIAGRIYVAGGLDANGRPSRSLQILNVGPPRDP